MLSLDFIKGIKLFSREVYSLDCCSIYNTLENPAITCSCDCKSSLLNVGIRKGYIRDMENISSNPSAIKFLEKNPQYIDYEQLASNPAALTESSEELSRLLEGYIKNLLNVIPHENFYSNLMNNPIIFSEKFKNYLIVNPTDIINNPAAMHFNHSSTWDLSSNPAACYESAGESNLNKHIEEIEYYRLSNNPAACFESAGDVYLEKHLDKIDWDALTYNPAAYELLEKYSDKVNKYGLFVNPCFLHLFEVDGELYNELLDECNYESDLEEELIDLEI